LLLLLAFVSLDRSLQLLQADPRWYRNPVIVAAACFGVLTAVVGALFMIRPIRYWWALVIALPMFAANFGSDLAVYGLRRSELPYVAFWIVEAGLLAFYAYHCHVPGYRWGATHKSGTSDYIANDTTVQRISR